MSDQSGHPLIQLLSFYYDNWEISEDTHPLLFQQQHGLAIDVPVGWPYIEAIHLLVNKAVKADADSKVVIIYPTSKIYKEVSEAIGDVGFVKYFSWYELYVAMDVASSDQRELSRFMELLDRSALAIFVGAPYGFPDVTNQVRRMCPGRLIILRTYEEKER